MVFIIQHFIKGNLTLTDDCRPPVFMTDEGSVRLSGGYPPCLTAWFYAPYDGKAVYTFLKIIPCSDEHGISIYIFKIILLRFNASNTSTLPFPSTSAAVLSAISTGIFNKNFCNKTKSATFTLPSLLRSPAKPPLSGVVPSGPCRQSILR